MLHQRAGGYPVELASKAAPMAPEGGAYGIEDASISPNGEWVYFGTCCEPAAGTVFRVRTDGSSEPERISLGYDPAPDPSGSWLAIADSAFSRILAGSLDGRSVLAVLDDGSVEIQYSEVPPGAGFGALAQGALAADW